MKVQGNNYQEAKMYLEIQKKYVQLFQVLK